MLNTNCLLMHVIKTSQNRARFCEKKIKQKYIAKDLGLSDLKPLLILKSN